MGGAVSGCGFTCIVIGPLFAFDVHDDVRLVNDAGIEKDEVRTAAAAAL